MEKLLEQYVEMFGEGFPISIVRSKTDEEIKQILQDCINSKKPYVMNYPDDDSDY
ncbi:MAG: hypothetical protein VB118_03060 [Oscillospiraceae bacterium]|nr:hypothetical protein [Oscillospiraceae bacterium]